MEAVNFDSEAEKLFALLKAAEGSLKTEDSKSKLKSEEQAVKIASLYKGIQAKLDSEDEDVRKLALILLFLSLRNLKDASSTALAALTNQFVHEGELAIYNSHTITLEIREKASSYETFPDDLICWFSSGKLRFAKGSTPRGFVKTLTPALTDVVFGSIKADDIQSGFTKALLAKIPAPHTCIFFAPWTGRAVEATLKDKFHDDEGREADEGGPSRSCELDDMF